MRETVDAAWGDAVYRGARRAPRLGAFSDRDLDLDLDRFPSWAGSMKDDVRGGESQGFGLALGRG